VVVGDGNHHSSCHITKKILKIFVLPIFHKMWGRIGENSTSLHCYHYKYFENQGFMFCHFGDVVEMAIMHKEV
jgi:hypothetical protein